MQLEQLDEEGEGGEAEEEEIGGDGDRGLEGPTPQRRKRGESKSLCSDRRDEFKGPQTTLYPFHPCLHSPPL